MMIENSVIVTGQVGRVYVSDPQELLETWDQHEDPGIGFYIHTPDPHWADDPFQIYLVLNKKSLVRYFLKNFTECDQILVVGTLACGWRTGSHVQIIAEHIRAAEPEKRREDRLSMKLKSLEEIEALIDRDPIAARMALADRVYVHGWGAQVQAVRTKLALRWPRSRRMPQEESDLESREAPI